MEQPVSIRAATHDDIPAIQHIASATWRITYGGAIDSTDIEDFLSNAYSVPTITSAINRLSEGYLVAELGGNIIGFAVTGINRDGKPELFAIYVLYDHQGSGAGHLLWTAAVDVQRRQGHSRLCCWVLDSNHRARVFYERQGAIMTELRDFVIGTSTVTEMRYCVSFRTDSS